jgi:hypothetical protein
VKIGPINIGLAKKEEPKSKVVAGKNTALYGQMGKIENLTPKQLRFIAEHESLFYKASHKKNRDTLQSWFSIKRLDDTEPFKDDIRILDEFVRRVRLKQKLQKGGVCKDIYGDGFIEKIYLRDKRRTSKMPPPKNAEIIALKVLNSECITTMKMDSGTKYYEYRPSGGTPKLIHPDRIIHIKDGLPYSDFGFSKVESLKNIMKSVMNSDTAVGEIVDWSSHGILDFKIENCSPEQEKYMNELVKKGNHYYIHDEGYELQVLNPQMGEPKSYFDYMHIKIAAIFEMPTHVLTGVQPGRYTGSEVGIADYHKDIANEQEMIFTPLIEDLFNEYLKSKGKRWIYKLIWNPTFVDELSEGQIMEKRALAAMNCYTSKMIGRKEARKILKDGVIDLNPEDVPKDLAKDVQPKPAIPNLNPPAKKEKTSQWRPLTDREKKMIVAERKLGEAILKEQEKKCTER